MQAKVVFPPCFSQLFSEYYNLFTKNCYKSNLLKDFGTFRHHVCCYAKASYMHTNAQYL